MPSQAQVDANRQNAQQSTGPRSEAGKAASSRNAVTHGFTGATFVVSPAEKEAWERFRDELLPHFNPQTPAERAYALAVIQNRWRIGQIQSTEAGIYALGRIEYADRFAGQSEDAAADLVRAFTYRTHIKELDRLNRYEARLARQCDKDLRELHRIQAERKEHESKQESEMLRLHVYYKEIGKTWNPAEFGFVLSLPEIEALLQRKIDRYQAHRMMEASLAGSEAA